MNSSLLRFHAPSLLTLAVVTATPTVMVKDVLVSMPRTMLRRLVNLQRIQGLKQLRRMAVCKSGITRYVYVVRRDGMTIIILIGRHMSLCSDSH